MIVVYYSHAYSVWLFDATIIGNILQIIKIDYKMSNVKWSNSFTSPKVSNPFAYDRNWQH